MFQASVFNLLFEIGWFLCTFYHRLLRRRGSDVVSGQLYEEVFKFYYCFL
jgi:hypothetical protein